jgi:predicted metal-dependent phosphoesterase TrpH
MSLRSPRLLSAIVAVAGIILGTFATRRSPESPPQIDGYSILAGDFHVHAFPGDGSLAPWSLRDEAARRGLDVFAVTNHNQVFTARFAADQSREAAPIVLIGEEITNPDYHLIAVGITRRVDANQPAERAIADVHAQGGVAIAAHPGPQSIGYTDAAVAQLDGTEAAHPASDRRERDEFTAFYQRARRLNPHVAAIGSSDFHAMPAPVGSCRTFLFVRERTAAGVLDAIRSGLTVALDEEGRLHGDPALVTIVEREIVPGSRDDAAWARVAVALAWAGLFGALLLRS